MLDILVECCSSDDNLIKVASEGLYDLFPDSAFYFVIDDGDFQQNLHGRCLQFGQYAFLDDFFDDERDGYDDVWFDFSKCLKDDFWAWDSRQVEDVTAYTEFIDELKSQSVHVSHGQHGHQPVAFAEGQYFVSKLSV